MSTFTAIPTRTNGQRILNTWFDQLRSAGITLENILGAGAIAETEFTIVNNQSSAANVTGLVIDPLLYRAATIEYFIYRNTTGSGATELVENGKIFIAFKTVADAWEITRESNGDAGITFTIINSGQVKYTSTNITGTPATSVMKFKATTIGVES